MVEGNIKTSYNVKYDLSKRIVAIFDEYDYFDLCRAVFCINSWRYTRPHLCLYITLNYSLTVCNKKGNKTLKTYEEFVAFCDNLFKEYNTVYDDAIIPDFGEIKISYNEHFYPVLMGTGHDFVFPFLHSIDLLARKSKQSQNFEEVLIYVDEIINQLGGEQPYASGKYKVHELSIPSESFFVKVSNFYQIITLSEESILGELSFDKTFDIDISHFIKNKNDEYYPLFNPSIIVDYFNQTIKKAFDTIEAKQEATDFLVYDALKSNFDISPEAKFVLCNIGVVEDEENKKILEEKLVQFAVFDEKSVLIFINEESIKDWNVEKYEKEVKNLLKDKKLKIIQFLEDVRLYDFSDRDNVEIIIYDSNICLGQMFKFSEKGKLLRNYIYDIISIIYLAKKPSDNRMREIKLLQDSQDMTAYIKRTESQNKALLVLEKFMRLESFILSNIEEEGSSFNLKELNDAAIKEGVKASTVKNIRTINYFWTIKGYIHKSEFNSQNRTDYIPTIAVDKLLAKLDKRRDVCRFIVEELYRMSEKAPIKQDEEALVEFSLIGLYEAYKEAPKLEIYDTPVTSTDIEDALLYLSKIGAIALQCGFLVSYNGMEIKRLITDNKIRYKNEDYRLLSEFYKQKIQQIHIVGEYANLMVRDYNAALQFVNDYFQMDFKRFIARYFKGSRAAEIERNITPEKYNQLFGELSDKQSEIITDDESKYIVVAAGPGSGKTRVLVHKLASLLLLEDVKHEQLLMVTFSRAAATEFKKRLIKLIGNAAAFVEIKTFHSYCFDLLGKIGSLEESENVVKDAAELINNGEVELGRITKTVVVIDEAQDMDENEFALIKALMNRNDDMRIIAVGDDDQNIYEFRGSDSKHLKELIEDYGAKKYEMTENYRSGKNIINFANAFAKTIQSRMKTDNGVPVKDFDGVVKITKHNSNLEQPIVNGILERKHKGSVCVLTTTNDEALRVLGLLNRNNVPAKLIQSTDGFQMYNLAEVRYFLKQIDCELKTPVISDALWKSTKERLERFYGKSSCYEICLKMILDFEKINKTKYRTDLEEFIKESKYEDFYTEEKETILVSTIHKSKGREFDTVYMLLNNVSCVNDEEKRKIYVGLTRAKEELYIHCNNNLFDNIATNIVCDENVYDEPSEIMLQLSYRDVVLDFFKDKKDTIIKLRSGDVLQLEEEHLCAVINGKLVKVIKYSKAFKEKLDFLKAKGYEPTAATIRFILAWKGKDDENETAIVLPDLSLKKR